MDKKTILVIEDDAGIREALRLILEAENYDVIEAASGKEGIELMSKQASLVILDVMLPDMSGYEVCKNIRRNYFTPILFLSALSGETEKYHGLKAGGDDYLVKPFSNIELLARVYALIRRNVEYNAVNETTHGIKMSPETRYISYNGKEAVLTATEYSILDYMFQRPRRVVSAKELYEAVWGSEFGIVSTNTVNVHIRNLREKLEDNPEEPAIIKTVWGKGYVFENECF